MNDDSIKIISNRFGKMIAPVMPADGQFISLHAPVKFCTTLQVSIDLEG
jgi:hypothetical protein